jgi:aspartate aminotransferase
VNLGQMAAMMASTAATTAALGSVASGQEVGRQQVCTTQKMYNGLRVATAFPGQKKMEESAFASIKIRSKATVTMAVATDVSRFEGVSMAPADPILGVSEAFKRDNSDTKLNLGVGAYRTEELQPYVLEVVKKVLKFLLAFFLKEVPKCSLCRSPNCDVPVLMSQHLSLNFSTLFLHGVFWVQAEKKMLEAGENKEYLPIEGLAAFNKATAELLLGADNPVIKQQRVATVQGLSGTGSLRLGAAFIQRYFPGVKVLISSPTWGEFSCHNNNHVSSSTQLSRTSLMQSHLISSFLL